MYNVVGFTGHEMLDKLDLVHMNGRIYDPLVARFISADPIIQDPEHSQSYNRYTYVWNNPTNLTDPTGFATGAPPDVVLPNSATVQACDNGIYCRVNNGVPTYIGPGESQNNNKLTPSKDRASVALPLANNGTAESSIYYRMLAADAYRSGNMLEAFQYNLKVLEVQNRVAAHVMQVADPSLADDGAMLLGAMAGNPQGTTPSIGSKMASGRRNGGITNAVEVGLVAFSTGQLDKKFKHAADFGLSTTKKNPETLENYKNALQSHIDSPGTYQHGTYQYVPESTVRFNFTTKNVMVVGKGGDFVTGWKLTPGTPQYDNYLKNWVLR